MALSKPDYPTYGPDTFTRLQELVDTFYANDLELKGLIDDFDPDPTPAPVLEQAAVTLATNYSNRAGYKAPLVSKLGDMVWLEGGALDCPATFSGGSYFTWGTLPSGYGPTDGLHRLINGTAWTTSGIIPGQFRLNANGTLQVVFQSSVSGAAYLIIPSGAGWSVN